VVSGAEFGEFWSRERDRLYRVLAVSLGDSGLAAEAVDEAMVRALQRWDRVGGYEDPAVWVLRVARNWATSWRRKLARRPTVALEDLDRPDSDDLPDVDVQGALSRLSAEQRLLLVLRFHEDWPVERVARTLGVAEGTVKSRTHRALRQLEGFREVTR
jgi:RNA polymerase sigma-70 factor, ECF subfamily